MPHIPLEALQRLTTNYIAVLSLLCACSSSVPEGLRISIEEALEEARAIFPQIRWQRILNQIEILIEPLPPTPVDSSKMN